jgi:ketol-acid reductoisomerase
MEKMMEYIALIGAGGKIGTRITNNLRHTQYNVRYVETAKAGIENLLKRGLSVTPVMEAIEDVDVVILAVPDRLIGEITSEIIPALKKNSLVITLNPAAGYGGLLPEREDISYFLVHPCHPPVINDETESEAKMDFFGGVKAKQHIVCALLKGEEEDY